MKAINPKAKDIIEGNIFPKLFFKNILIVSEIFPAKGMPIDAVKVVIENISTIVENTGIIFILVLFFCVQNLYPKTKKITQSKKDIHPKINEIEEKTTTPAFPAIPKEDSNMNIPNTKDTIDMTLSRTI